MSSTAILICGVAAAFFGCGFACGLFASTRRTEVAADTGAGSARSPRSIQDMRHVIQQIDQGLLQYGRRQAGGGGSPPSAGLSAGHGRELLRLIEESHGFEQRLREWADMVCNAQTRPSRSGEGPPADHGPSSRLGTADQGGMLHVGGSGAERRSESRHPYLCRQWIAPYNGVSVPGSEEFRSVQCRDISSGGISFFLDHEPKYELIVVRLTGAEQARFLTARIRRVNRCTSPYGAYAVGCQFLGTMDVHELPADLDAALVRLERQGATAAQPV